MEAPTVTFIKAYPDAIAPLRADKAACGVLPTVAFRHCEPVRTASSFGWYVFPPEDVILRWNGADTLIQVDGRWQPLTQTMLPGMNEHWDRVAPDQCKGLAPPFVSVLPIPGHVQVWSGLLCKTAPGWSVGVRSLVNMQASHLYRAFDGIVESDWFGPFPLFMNFQLLSTDADIVLPRFAPLFQIQPLLKSTYNDEAHRFCVREIDSASGRPEALLSQEEWAGFRKTVRLNILEDEMELEAGTYGPNARRREKHRGESA